MRTALRLAQLGYIKRLRYFNVRKTNAELQELTGPPLDLDFTKMNPLDPRITFTRSSTATYTDRTGVVRLSGANQARFDYDPVTLAARGLLIEEQRTNRLQYSNALTFASWTPGTGTTRVLDATGPDGVANSATSVSLSTSGPGIYQTVTPTATDTFSVWLRAKSGTPQVVVFLAVGQLTTVTLNTTWQRFQVTGSGANPGIRVDYPVALTNVTVEIWGAQIEAGAFATSIIPTTSAAVTRAADLAVMTGTNFSVVVERQAPAPFVINAETYSVLQRLGACRRVRQRD